MADFAANPRSAPTMISGTRGPENVDPIRVIADVQNEIVLVRPSAAPFMSLSNKFRDSRTATQRRFDWFEKDEYPRAVVLAADSIVGDTVLDVETGTGARIAGRFVLLNTRTRESVYVTSVSSDALTVTRGIGGDQADMVTGDTLVFTRPIAEDGAGIGTLKSIQELNKFNYTEILRTPYGFTGRQVNTDLYGGKDPMTERKWHAIEHKKSIESQYFFGRRNLITGAGGHEVTFSGGLEDFIVSNIWDVTGMALSERAFVEALEVLMREGRGGNRNGSATKYLFASSRWLTEIEFWAKDKLFYEPLDDELGLSARTYTSTHGKVMLIASPVLDENHPDYAFLVDLNHITPVMHQGRGTKLLKNREGNDIDGSQEEYMTDGGLQVELEFAHAIFKGLSA